MDDFESKLQILMFYILSFLVMSKIISYPAIFVNRQIFGYFKQQTLYGTQVMNITKQHTL